MLEQHARSLPLPRLLRSRSVTPCYRIGLFFGVGKVVYTQCQWNDPYRSAWKLFLSSFLTLWHFLSQQIKVDEIKFPLHNSMTWIHKMQFFHQRQARSYWIRFLSFVLSWISLWESWMGEPCINSQIFNGVLDHLQLVYLSVCMNEWMNEWVSFYLSIEWWKKKNPLYTHYSTFQDES